MRALQLHLGHLVELAVGNVFPARGLDAEALARADALCAQVETARGAEVEEAVCEGYGDGGLCGAVAGCYCGGEGGGGGGAG